LNQQTAIELCKAQLSFTAKDEEKEGEVLTSKETKDDW
jgi:hypothetical protein